MRFFSLTIAAASLAALAHTASAADLGARAGRAAPVVAPVVASWTGCYVGANAGFGIAPTDWSVTGVGIGFGEHDATGGLAGGQVGCDIQNGNFVFGVEGLFDWAGLSGSHDLIGGTMSTDSNWLATVTGRVGYAADRTLFYVRGGAAWINNDFTIQSGETGKAEVTRTGWTLGVGAEWAFAPAWSARAEYNYMGFGSDTPTFCGGGLCTPAFDIDQVVHTFTVGLNYRFR